MVLEVKLDVVAQIRPAWKPSGFHVLDGADSAQLTIGYSRSSDIRIPYLCCTVLRTR